MNLLLALALLAISWWATTRLLKWLLSRVVDDLPAGKRFVNKSKIHSHEPAEARR
jgi:hypothetical protein